MSENTTTNPSPVADRLPQMTADNIADATDAQSISWANGLMGEKFPGDLCIMEDGLILLQKVDTNTARCIRVYDLNEGMWLLAMYREIFKAAGIELQIAPYTLVTTFPPEMMGEQAKCNAQYAERIEKESQAAAEAAVATPTQAFGHQRRHGGGLSVSLRQ